jgi:hypothetical protein
MLKQWVESGVQNVFCEKNSRAGNKVHIDIYTHLTCVYQNQPHRMLTSPSRISSLYSSHSPHRFQKSSLLIPPIIPCKISSSHFLRRFQKSALLTSCWGIYPPNKILRLSRITWEVCVGVNLCVYLFTVCNGVLALTWHAGFGVLHCWLAFTWET